MEKNRINKLIEEISVLIKIGNELKNQRKNGDPYDDYLPSEIRSDYESFIHRVQLMMKEYDLNKNKEYSEQFNKISSICADKKMTLEKLNIIIGILEAILNYIKKK